MENLTMEECIGSLAWKTDDPMMLYRNLHIAYERTCLAHALQERWHEFKFAARTSCV